MISRQPTLFISHGAGPAFFMEDEDGFSGVNKNSLGKKFFAEKLSSLLPQKPSGIVVVSAHWEEPGFCVSYQTNPSLIYDYGGFPSYTYAPYLKYDAPTDLNLADEIISLLSSENIPCGKKDRGFDHGVFCPLKLIYPNADIPIVQLSLKNDFNAAEHIAVGRALAPLRDKNILIIGSGQATHNARTAPKVKSAPYEFTDWLYNQLSSLNPNTIDKVEENIVDIMNRAPHAKWAHPRVEHLEPLFVAFGAGIAKSTADNSICKDVKATRVYTEMLWESMSLDTYLFD